MPSHLADRSLLFGILALQMDFISRDALVAAMHAWVLDKTKALGQILREQNALSEDEQGLIDALVGKHLQKHGNDVQQSLAAVPSIHSVRQRLQQIADADVQASLAGVGDTPTNDPYATSAHVGPAVAALTRFQILRPHARGGPGEVFVALDGQLKREVALKEIQARHADLPESRARFLLEAEVTGSLEHPGIVPVYGLECYPDGRPYYAMRFIRGDSLKDAIADFHAGRSRLPGGTAEDPARQAGPEKVPPGRRDLHSLAFRELLGRFVDVCNAVAYAHSRGVLHRDLKPANVMLGKYCETLVVDWGLAKVVGKSDVETTEMAVASSADSALTQAGRAMGTPAYMSPEQAAGRLDRLGPASDVYSLGATLYCLLTGKPPFTESDVGAVLGKVQKGDFTPPRQLNAQVPAALGAVCLKAMALKPEDRYASPRELAGEIEHWLADEPVSAHREPLRKRAGRWARRHPAVVAGTTALVFTALLAMTIGGLLLGREQQAKLEQQRKARQAQVGTLLDAAPQAVPAILEGLAPYRDEICPLLQEAANKPEPANATPEAVRLWRQHCARAALALLVEDPGQKEPLTARLLEEELDPAEMLLVRDALRPHAAELKGELWRKANEENKAGAFRALVALAAYDPDSPRWQKAAEAALGEMLKANPLHLGSWVGSLRPVKEHLLPLLGKVFRGADEKLKEYRQVAASVLADYAADRPETLAELLLDGDAKQYAVIKPVLLRHREQAIARMRGELSARPDYWKDLPLDPKWQTPTPELVREVEEAGGIVAERFALCQSLPLERGRAVAEGMRGAGYRPVRVRPWERETVNKNETRVALVWTRDASAWTLRTNLTAAQVKKSPAGMIPADVTGYHTRDGVRYAVLWRKPGKDEQAVVYAGVPEAKHKSATDVFKNDGYLPATVQALLGTDGAVRHSGVWWKGPEKVENWSIRWPDTESAHDDAVFAGEHLLLDVHLGPALPTPRQLAWVAGLTSAPHSLAALGLSSRYREIVALTAAPRQYASVWRDDTVKEAAGLHGLTADAHLLRCRELVAQGYRPVALSLAALAGAKGALAASAWHRPVPPAAEKDRLASRQATAAATLIHLGQAADVWPLWRHSPDPTVRSFLVERIGSRGVAARLLVERLEVEKDVSARRALIVALGELGENDLPASVRGPLAKKLLAWYRDDPDAGIHGAIDWLLRHGSEGPAKRPLDWGCAKELERIDSELAKASRGRKSPDLSQASRGRKSPETAGPLRGLSSPARPATWFVNFQLQTFTVIPGPIDFRMGSPLWEPDRIPVNEKPHRRIIPRSYAIMTKPVTVAQWQQFLKDRPDVPKDFLKRYSPEPDGPIINISWFMAAQYCNWLSEKEGIPREQWCYPETIEEGMKPYPDYLRRTGYRLPSEAECEHACRADTASSRSFGSAQELLSRYSWHQANSQDRTHPVGQKRPNDFGLFDMHGNVWMWCQETAFLYRSGRIEDKEDIRDITERLSRVLRGASFVYLAPYVRSAIRIVDRPANRVYTFGLRVARTYH